MIPPDAAPSSSLRCDVATAADLPALHRLYTQLADGASKLTLETLQRTFVDVEAHPGTTLYVVRDSDQIVGSFLFYLYPALGERCRPASVVEDVVVDNTLRRRGVGRFMMNFALARARELGCYKLALSSNEKRADAHAFYESLGFARHGVSFLAML